MPPGRILFLKGVTLGGLHLPCISWILGKELSYGGLGLWCRPLSYMWRQWNTITSLGLLSSLSKVYVTFLLNVSVHSFLQTATAEKEHSRLQETAFSLDQLMADISYKADTNVISHTWWWLVHMIETKSVVTSQNHPLTVIFRIPVFLWCSVEEIHNSSVWAYIHIFISKDIEIAFKKLICNVA